MQAVHDTGGWNEADGIKAWQSGGNFSRNSNVGSTQPAVERKPKKKREDGLRQAEKMLLTWLISDRDIFDKVVGYIKPEDFIDPLFSGGLRKYMSSMRQAV